MQIILTYITILFLIIYICYQHYQTRNQIKNHRLKSIEFQINNTLINKICTIYHKTNNFNNIIKLLQQFYNFTYATIIYHNKNLASDILEITIPNDILPFYNKIKYEPQSHNYFTPQKKLHFYTFHIYNNIYLLATSKQKILSNDYNNIITNIPLFTILLKNYLKQQQKQIKQNLQSK